MSGTINASKLILARVFTNIQNELILAKNKNAL